MPKPRKLPKVRCTAISKRSGEQCKSAPMRGYPVCCAHNTALDAARRFGSPAQAREASALAPHERYPRLREVIARRVEERAEDIVGAAVESLRATAMTVDRDGDEHVHPDYLTRLRGADTLMQRALGRPASEQTIHSDVQAVVVGLDGADPEAREHISALLGRRPASREEPAPRLHPVHTLPANPATAGSNERLSVYEPDSQRHRDDVGGVARDGQNGPGSVRDDAAAALPTRSQPQSPESEPDEGGPDGG